MTQQVRIKNNRIIRNINNQNDTDMYIDMLATTMKWMSGEKISYYNGTKKLNTLDYLIKDLNLVKQIQYKTYSKLANVLAALTYTELLKDVRIPHTNIPLIMYSYAKNPNHNTIVERPDNTENIASVIRFFNTLENLNINGAKVTYFGKPDLIKLALEEDIQIAKILEPANPQLTGVISMLNKIKMEKSHEQQ